jgi:hypothetical protein
MNKPYCCAVIGGAAALCSSAIAQLDPHEQMLELVKDVQGQQALMLGRYWGSDTSSPLLFSMHADAGTRSFGFHSLPGQTYRGLAFSMDTEGIYHAGTDDWT